MRWSGVKPSAAFESAPEYSVAPEEFRVQYEREHVNSFCRDTPADRGVLYPLAEDNHRLTPGQKPERMCRVRVRDDCDRGDRQFPLLENLAVPGR